MMEHNLPFTVCGPISVTFVCVQLYAEKGCPFVFSNVLNRGFQVSAPIMRPNTVP